MKKSCFITIVILLCALLGVGFLLMSNKKSLQIEDKEATSLPMPNDANSGFGQYLRAPRENFRPILTENKTIPQDCIEFFDQIQKLNMLKIGKESTKLTFQLLPPINVQCPFDHLGFKSLVKNYTEECQPKDKNLSEEITDSCAFALFIFRARVTKLTLKGKALKDIKDMEQLVDLIFAELLEASPEKDLNPKNIKEITDRMMEIDPNMYAANKMSATSDIMIAFDSVKNGASVNEIEQSWANAQKSLERAQKIKANDQSMEDAAIAVNTRGLDTERTYTYAQNMVEQKPDYAKSWYLLGYAQWRRGEKQNAFTSIQKAMSIEPENKIFKEIWTEIHKPNANTGSYKRYFSIGLGPDDFN